MKYIFLLFVLIASCKSETKMKKEDVQSVSRNYELIGQWIVVEASITPFDHISCENLTVKSIFEFTAEGILKVIDGTSGNYCNLELTQHYSFKDSTLHLVEWDMLFHYEVELINEDSLFLRIDITPERYYTQQMQLEEVRECEMKEIAKNGILVKMVRYKNGQ